MTSLPGVLRCRTLRRTVQVRLGIQPPAVAQWRSHLHGLATAIHETSRLGNYQLMEYWSAECSFFIIDAEIIVHRGRYFKGDTATKQRTDDRRQTTEDKKQVLRIAWKHSTKRRNPSYRVPSEALDDACSRRTSNNVTMREFDKMASNDRLKLPQSGKPIGQIG